MIDDDSAPTDNGAPLAVFTGGALRHVNGVTSSTTCSQLVYALAHATQQKGRFVLVATFDDDPTLEHRMTADERPLAVVEASRQRGARATLELRRLDPVNDVIRSASPSGSAASSSTSSRVAEMAACDNVRQRIPFKLAEENQQQQKQQRNHPQEQQNGSNPSLNENLAMRKDSKRPPPPAYAEVIEQRCNSLTRRHRSPFPQSPVVSNEQSADFSVFTILGMTVDDIEDRHFKAGELKALVDAQSEVITTQKNQLLGLELTLSNDFERELVQLRKQHNNLNTVLNSLRNANWPMRVEAERAEAEHLHTAIDAMRTAIENKRRELHEVLELQQTLERQLAFQAEKADGFHQATSRGLPLYS